MIYLLLDGKHGSQVGVVVAQVLLYVAWYAHHVRTERHHYTILDIRSQNLILWHANDVYTFGIEAVEGSEVHVHRPIYRLARHDAAYGAYGSTTYPRLG